MTDAEIVARVRAGDREAYSRLVERYRQAIYGLAYHHLNSSEDAQDVAQIAFVHAFQHLEQLRNPAAFGAWLRQIAVSQCRMWRRQPLLLSTDVFLSADASISPTGEISMRQAEDRLLIQQALACLSPQSRLTLTLFYLRSYSLMDIATFLNVPVTTVKSRLRNARARIRKEHWDMAEAALTPQPMNTDFAWQVMQKLNSGVVRSVAFSPDGNLLAVYYWDEAGNETQVFDLQTGALLQTFAQTGRSRTTIAFAPDSRTLASGSEDENVTLWQLERLQDQV